MSTIASTTLSTSLSGPSATETAKKTHPVRRATVVSGVVASVATTAVAALALAADVPLEVDGEAIPLLGFAQMTLLGAVLGGCIMAGLNRFSAHAYRWFVGIAVVLTALSCIPSVTLPPDAASKAILVATHVLAAIIIVPALARQARS